MTTRSKILCMIYGALSLTALIACWSQNMHYMPEPLPGGLLHFIRDTWVTAASRSITLDLLIFTTAAFIWMALEAREKGIKYLWAYYIAALAIAISVAFPLFLIARERAFYKKV